MTSEKNKALGLKRFKKNGLDTVWSSISSCVFESNQNKTVIGRYDGKNYADFDEETLRLCEKFNHKYGKNILLGINDDDSDQTEGGWDEDENYENSLDKQEVDTVGCEDDVSDDKSDEDENIEDGSDEDGSGEDETEKIEYKSKTGVCGNVTPLEDVNKQLVTVSQSIASCYDCINTLQNELKTSKKHVIELNNKLNKKDKENTELATKCKKLQSAITAML